MKKKQKKIWNVEIDQPKSRLDNFKCKVVQLKPKTLAIALCAGIAILATSLTANGIMLHKINELTRPAIPFNEYFGTNEAAAISMERGEAEEAIATLNSALNNIRKKNVHISVIDGSDTYVTTVYNTNREAIAQASESQYITVYRNDNKAIRFSDYIDYGCDSDVLSLLEKVYEMATEGKATILKAPDDETGESEGFTQLIIDINGWNDIGELYNKFDTEFSNMMVQQLKTSIAELSANENSGVLASDEVNFRFVYVLNNTEKSLEAAGCFIYIGNKKPEQVAWEDLQASWQFTGYDEVYDWKLDNRWYSLNWDDIDQWDSTEEAEELVAEQMDTVVGMMKQWAEDNGTVFEDTNENSNNEEASLNSDNGIDESSITDNNNNEEDNESSEEINEGNEEANENSEGINEGSKDR